jgi:MFS family permease
VPRLTKQAGQVAQTYYLMTAMFTLSMSLIWGINTLFMLGAGLDILQIFIANAVFTAAMALLEIPTGVLADTKGRRLSFLLSVVVLSTGTFGLVWSFMMRHPMAVFVCWSVWLGLGFTFYSGAAEAWVVDALKGAGYDGPLDWLFAKTGMISSSAMLIGTVLGGILATHHLTVPYLLRGVLLIGLFALAYARMFDEGFTVKPLKWRDVPREMQRMARVSIRFGWNRVPVRLLVLCGAVQSGFIWWGWYAWQPYFLELLGKDAPWIAGVIGAFTSLATLLGNWLVDRLRRVCSRRTTMLAGAALLFSVGAILTGVFHSFWPAVVVFLLTMLAMGIFTPVKQAALHDLIPSEQRASVISFDSLVGSLGGVVGQPGLGWLAKTRGIGPGYIVGGAFSLLALPLLWLLRGRPDGADDVKCVPEK